MDKMYKHYITSSKLNSYGVMIYTSIFVLYLANSINWNIAWFLLLWIPLGSFYNVLLNVVVKRAIRNYDFVEYPE